MLKRNRSPSSLLRETDTPALFVGTEDYDAFDHEDDDFDDDESDEDEDEEEDLGYDEEVHSDFHVIASDSDDGEYCEASYAFDTPSTDYQPAFDPGGKAMDLIMETERQDEVSVAPNRNKMISNLTMLGGRTA